MKYSNEAIRGNFERHAGENCRNVNVSPVTADLNPQCDVRFGSKARFYRISCLSGVYRIVSRKADIKNFGLERPVRDLGHDPNSVTIAELV